MIADRETNVIFVADTLEPRFPDVYRNLKSILESHAIPLRVIPGTRDIWCRDYMPIQAAEDRFIQFRYEPDYLDGKDRRLRLDGTIGPALPWLKTCALSEINLDGGNVVGGGRRVIVTNKVFRENRDTAPGSVEKGLIAALDVDELIVIPAEPFDVFGHADGMVSWLDDQTVLINDYSVVGSSYRNRVRGRLRRHGIDLVELPYRPLDDEHGGIPSAVGNWMNFIRIQNLLIAPSFGMNEDEEAFNILRRFHPGCAVDAVDCRTLAAEGGLLHCVTWQAKIDGGTSFQARADRSV